VRNLAAAGVLRQKWGVGASIFTKMAIPVGLGEMIREKKAKGRIEKNGVRILDFNFLHT
jgi:hypothetical protein